MEGSGGLGIRQVKIHARYLGTSIIVRQVGRYLTFAIRMPEDLAEENGGLQLCLHGCPRSEVIKAHVLNRQQNRLMGGWYGEDDGGELQPGLSSHVDMLERATTKCREMLQVEDVYFQSCVFDLLTTGDLEFSMAAYGALEDLKALPPSTLKQSSPRTPHIYSRGTIVTPSVFAALLLMLLLNWGSWSRRQLEDGYPPARLFFNHETLLEKQSNWLQTVCEWETNPKRIMAEHFPNVKSTIPRIWKRWRQLICLSSRLSQIKEWKLYYRCDIIVKDT